MWPFKRKKKTEDRRWNGPGCTHCRSKHTIAVAGPGAGEADFVKIWRGQRYLTCRCLDCGQEFYADAPREGLPEEVLQHDGIPDDEDALREAEEELKRQIDESGDRRAW